MYVLNNNSHNWNQSFGCGVSTSVMHLIFLLDLHSSENEEEEGLVVMDKVLCDIPLLRDMVQFHYTVDVI